MKVGYYVRTSKGIAKYLGLGRDVLKHETNKNTYEHYFNQHIFDECVFSVGHDYGDTLTNKEFENIKQLAKVSNQIIDLIEVGDYVNGNKIVHIQEEEFPNYPKRLLFAGVDENNIDDVWEVYNNDDIKSIVTKEQFESIEYKAKDGDK